MNWNRNYFLLLFALLPAFLLAQEPRQQQLFNTDWKFHKGDLTGAEKTTFNDDSWRTLNLPHDWSVEGPFSNEWASGTGYLPGGIGWYRKTFSIPTQWTGKQ